MDIKKLAPRQGKDCYRIGDSDDVVVMMNLGTFPSGKVTSENHGLIVICTEGMAQFEYDGQEIKLHENDLFLYWAHSIASNFMSSSDFNCRQIWFSRGQMWDINMYGVKSLADLTYLKNHPLVHLTDDDMSLLDSYFQLACRRFSDHSPVIYKDIARSLTGTILLEILAMLRRDKTDANKENTSASNPKEDSTNTSSLHKQLLAEKFMTLVEQSDGRIRRVEEFAKQLNTTPKYLSTLLKETLARRPSIIINLFTLKAIERRLRFTDMTMQEIANDLNFPNASFFGKYVKERLGMTPLEYRRKYQTNNVE